MSIGTKIKDIRKSKGLTQVQLADKAQISRSYLGDLEGDRYNPSLETLRSIANALGVDVSTFVSNDPNVNFSPRDKRDIARDIERFEASLESDEGLMFDGEPLSPEAKESLLAAMRLGLEAAKMKNKERFTPKKYRED